MIKLQTMSFQTHCLIVVITYSFMSCFYTFETHCPLQLNQNLVMFAFKIGFHFVSKYCSPPNLSHIAFANY